MTATALHARQDLERNALGYLASTLARDREADGLSPGERAELRRMTPADGPLPPVMWRLLTTPALSAFAQAHGARDIAERALAVVVRITIEAGPAGNLAIGRMLGADPAYAEARFVRLLRARGLAETAFEARLAARWCAARGGGVAMTGGRSGFGRFLLAAALDSPGAERRAHAIARDYFQTPGADDGTPDKDF